MIRRIVVATMRATKAPLQALRSDRHRRPRTEQRWLCGSCQDEAMFTSQTVACPAYVTLSDTEHHMLDELPYAANMVPWTLRCHLPAGHHGPHHALGQSAGHDEWWLAWDFNDLRQLAVLPPCTATSDDDTRSEPEPCLLFAEHPGRHGFESDSNDMPHRPDIHLAEYLDTAAAVRRHIVENPAAAQAWASLSVAAAVNRLAAAVEQAAKVWPSGKD